MLGSPSDADGEVDLAMLGEHTKTQECMITLFKMARLVDEEATLEKEAE